MLYCQYSSTNRGGMSSEGARESKASFAFMEQKGPESISPVLQPLRSSDPESQTKAVHVLSSC